MGWEDKPSEAQVNALWYWFKWEMPTEEANDALKWFEKNATRREAFDEVKRVRELNLSRKLNREACFNSEVWKRYFDSKSKGGM